MKKRFAQQQSEPAHRSGFLWLALGLLCWLFATNGRWDLPVAAWLAPLFLLRFTRTRSPLRGFLGVSVASMLVTLFWLYESNFYDPQQVFSLVNLLMFAIILSTHLLLVIPCLLDRLLTPRLVSLSGLLATLIFPLGRVVCEYLATLAIPYGSFFSPAYTQSGNLPLVQLVAITGTYGISFLIAWVASVSNWIWEQRFSWSNVRATILVASSVLILVLLGGSIRLAFFPPSAQTVRVAGVNSAQATYARAQNLIGNPNRALVRAAFTATNNELLDASQREALAGARIIVWPEQGGLTFAEDEAGLMARGQSLAREEHIYLDMAYEVFQPDPSRNRAVLIDPQGQVVWTYDKSHPAPGIDPSIPGDGIIPVADTPYGRLANVICLDAFYPQLMQQVGNKGLDLMLVPSLEWPGITNWVPQATAFRAVEYGYSLVRPATDDVSLAVDYQGHVLAATDYFTTHRQIIIASVPLKGTWTIYGLVGDLFTWLCLASLLALTVGVVIRSVRKSPSAGTLTAPLATESAEEKEEVSSL